MRKNQNIASRLSRSVVAIVAISTVALAISILAMSNGHSRRDTERNAFLELSLLEKSLHSILTDVETAASANARIAIKEMAKPNPDKEVLDKLAFDMISHYPSLNFCSFLLEPTAMGKETPYAPYTQRTPDNKTVSGDMGNEYAYYAHMEYYIETRERDSGFWTEPFYGKVSKILTYSSYSIPLHDGQGRFLGIFNMDINSDVIDSILANTSSSSAYNILTSRSGKFIIHPRKELIMTSLTDFAAEHNDEAMTNAVDDVLNGHRGMMNSKNQDGRYYGFHSTIPDIGWKVITIYPYKDLFGQNLYIFLVAILIILCITFAIAYTIRRTIRKSLKPIEQLTDTARLVAKGQLDAPLPDMSNSSDEVATLVNSFHNMQHAIADFVENEKEYAASREREEQELNIARNIQTDMLPAIQNSKPGYESIDFHATLKPAREVGGDLYYYELTEQRILFAVGDVSGKGIPASIIVAKFVNTIQNATPDILADASRSTTFFNQSLCRGNSSFMFTTAAICSLHLTDGLLTNCNAGHTDPIVVSPDGKASLLDTPHNFPLGLKPDFSFEKQYNTIAPGSTLFYYSDGVTEASDEHDEFYGTERLLRQLEHSHGKCAKDIIDDVYDDIRRFVGNAEQSDDITMFAIRYLKPIPPDEAYKRRFLFNCQLSEVDRLCDVLNQLGTDDDFDQDILKRILLAIEEAVVNVINYGFPDMTPQERATHKVELRYQMEPDRTARFNIIDDGIAFNPVEHAEVDIDQPIEQRPLGGLGIHLIKQTMDEMTYCRKDGLNILTLKKRV